MSNAGRREIAEVELAEQILRAGNDVEADFGLPGRGGGRRALSTGRDRQRLIDLGVVVAVSPHHPQQQVAIGPRAARKLGEVVVVVAQPAQAREIAEPLAQRIARGERLAGRESQLDAFAQRHDLGVEQARDLAARSDAERLELALGRFLGELDVGLGRERLDLGEDGVVGPGELDLGQRRQRRRRIELGDGDLERGSGGRLLDPGFGVGDRAVGDQLLERRLGGGRLGERGRSDERKRSAGQQPGQARQAGAT